MLARNNNKPVAPSIAPKSRKKAASVKKSNGNKRPKRPSRPFPSCAFEVALEFAQDIHRFGSGKPIRRVTLFNELQKSPDSSTSRQLIIDAGKYGLVKGGYQADALQLTPQGAVAVDETLPARERTQARVDLAIMAIPAFKGLYEAYAGIKLPARSVLADALEQQGVAKDHISEAIDTFLVNVKFVGLLRTLSGAERLITVEHLLDELPSSYTSSSLIVPVSPNGDKSPQPTTDVAKLLGETCFYITPIGDEGSEARQHADLFLGSLIEPALEQFGLNVARADQIDKPGMITKQIIQYLLQAKLVIADLSFHNPNVFYELALRHATRLPTVQIIRAGDVIPFDINQNRTIVIDNSSIYALVPKLDFYKAQIASHVRRALEDPDNVDNPITSYAPSFKVQIS